MIFVDTNIWIYAFTATSDRNKHEIAKELIERKDIAVSVQLIGEICNVLITKTRAHEDLIREVLLAFENRFTPLTLEPKHLLRASDLRRAYRLSHWDSLMVVAALELKATIFYSEDLQDGLIIEGTLRVVNPLKN